MKKMLRGLCAFAAVLCLFLAAAVPVSASCSEHSFNAGVVTLEPSCDTIGIITYTCSACGFQVTEKIGNLGHRFENGVCLECGVREDGGVPETETDAARAPVLPAEPVREVLLQQPAFAAAPAEAAPRPEQHSPSGSYALNGGLVLALCAFGLFTGTLLFISLLKEGKRQYR